MLNWHYLCGIGPLLVYLAHARTDDCNLMYWKPRLMGTILVDDSYSPPPSRKSTRKLSFFDKLAKPKRVLGPHTEMKDMSIDSERITVLVNENHIVVGVDCY